MSEEIKAEDKAFHYTLSATVDHESVGEERVLVEIHADNPLLGIIGLAKLGRSDKVIMGLVNDLVENEDSEDD